MFYRGLGKRELLDVLKETGKEEFSYAAHILSDLRNFEAEGAILGYVLV